MLDWFIHPLEPPKTWAEVAQIVATIVVIGGFAWGIFWAFVKFVWRRLRLPSQSRDSESAPGSSQSVVQSVSGQGINTGDNSPLIQAGRDVYSAGRDIITTYNTNTQLSQAEPLPERRDELKNVTRRQKAGSVRVEGDMKAGDNGGGGFEIEGGVGSGGADGGDVEMGPGDYRSGDGGPNGPGGSYHIKGGDARP